MENCPVDATQNPWKHRLWQGVRRAVNDGWPQAAISRHIAADSRQAIHAFITRGTMGPERLRTLEAWLLNYRYLPLHKTHAHGSSTDVVQEDAPSYGAQTQVDGMPLWRLIAITGEDGLELSIQLNQIENQRAAFIDKLKTIDQAYERVLEELIVLHQAQQDSPEGT